MILMDIRSVEKTHVPELEKYAWNQMPKTHDHRDVRLFRYEDTKIYQWWTCRKGAHGWSVFPESYGEPFWMEQH